MATSFPSGLDSFVNPSASDALDSGVVPHAAQHANVNDAVEALEAKVGVNGSAVTSSLDFKVSAVEDGLSVARPLLTRGAYIDGTNGLVLSGLVGNYASSPDSAALDITGDIDIKVKVTLDDWTPSTTNAFVGKIETNTNRSYWFSVSVSGLLSLTTSPDGTGASQLAGQASVATGLANGATKWVRGTLDVDDGAGNRVYKFYMSDDGSSWSQLGTTVTTAGTTSISSNSSGLSVGSLLAGTSSTMSGTVHRVIVENGFDGAGSVVFDADFESEAADTLAFTEDSTNAATVSVVTTRYTVGLPGRGYHSVSTFGIANNYDWFDQFVVTQPVEVDMLVFEVTTAPASNSTLHGAIYAATDNYQPTGAPLVVFGPTTVSSGVTGNYYVQVTPVTLQPGQYVLGTNCSVTFTTRAARWPSNLVHTLGSNATMASTYRSRSNAAFPNPSNGWHTRGTSNVGHSSFMFLRWRPL